MCIGLHYVARNIQVGAASGFAAFIVLYDFVVAIASSRQACCAFPLSPSNGSPDTPEGRTDYQVIVDKLSGRLCSYQLSYNKCACGLLV